MISLISFLIVIAICVISHEGGHFFAAKWRGVLVHEFSFGMGKQLWSRRKGETLFSLRALPIGGYVKLEGEDEVEEDGTKPADWDPSRSLNNKKPWERFVIIAAGAVVNIILAWLFAAAYLTGFGVYDFETPRIGLVMENTPAQSAGFMAGDVIKTINGVHLHKWADIRNTIHAAKESKFNITYSRGSQTVAAEVEIPVSKKYNGRLLGVQPSRVRYSLFMALSKSMSYSFKMCEAMLSGLWMLITGQTRADVVGPVGIAVMAGDAIKEGFWSFIYFISLISLNLGIVNLLPFPALDGGRLVFIAIEMITGRRVPEKYESWVHYCGFIVLMALIIIITGSDIFKLFHKF